jgi:hypothetical protein
MKACFKKCRTASVVNYRDKCKVFTLQHKIKHKNKQQTKQQQQNIKTKTKTKKPPKIPNKPERRKGTYLIPQISNKMSRFKNIASTGVQTIHLRVRSACSIKEIFLCVESKS